MEVGILAFSGYVPKSRLQRSEIFKAHAWFNPGLKGLARGERATANWDEDSVTMAVEAARNCLADQDRSVIDGVYMASTSYPFHDRQNAGIVADALNLSSSLQTLDLSSSMRAGTSGLITALQAARGGAGNILFTASEKRNTRAGSPLEMTNGDGAAAFLIGEGEVMARLLGSHTESVDFVDHFRGEGADHDYTWEERWVRDEGYMKIVPTAITALLEKTGIKAEEIDAFCFPVAARNVAAGLAKKIGINSDAVADNLQSTLGEAGSAHPALMLALALENAKSGDKILVASFGQGCDALLFEATDKIKAAASSLTQALQNGRSEENYNRFLVINGELDTELGIRAEVDKNTGLTTHYRNRYLAQRMVGGECTKCGTIQFPKTNMCVNENCGEIGTQEDHPFAEKTASLNSFTADRLTYSPDPPAYYGMVQFEGGGRLMADFTDIAPNAELSVGDKMRMVFRVKDFDRKRDFRRYFWKAVPIEETQKGV